MAAARASTRWRPLLCLPQLRLNIKHVFIASALWSAATLLFALHASDHPSTMTLHDLALRPSNQASQAIAGGKR